RSRSRDRRRQDKGRDDEAAAAAAAADMAEEERQRDLDEDEEERRRLAEQETKMARTVMLTSLTHRSDERDIYEFFSTGAGTVRDVQIIRDARTGRSRGVAYVEMSTGEGMVRAIGLSGQSLKVEDNPNLHKIFQSSARISWIGAGPASLARGAR
ncbi:unnamed protein product, partial [Prorocentrum cordatum]